jgi:Tfp pilus assembly protein PilF/VanZ family protein
MRLRLLLATGVAGVAAVIFAENLFGRELNAFFLRFPGIDKGLHTLEYLFVVVLLHALVRRTLHVQHELWHVRLAIGLSVLLAALDESLQRLAPARNVETLDFVANLAGITMGWVVVGKPARRTALAATAVAVSVAAFVAWDTHVKLIDYSRALRYEREHDFVRAREHYLKALDAGLRTPGLFNELGWVEIESGVGDPVKAVAYARTALEMQPGNADIADTYGWALLHAGRTSDAVAQLEKAYAASPEMYCIHYHLGAAYLAANQREKAEYHFKRQLEKPGTREAAFAREALERMDASGPGGAS